MVSESNFAPEKLIAEIDRLMAEWDNAASMTWGKLLIRCRAALEASHAPDWRSIDTAPRNRKIVVGYANRLGNWRSVMGHYYAEGELPLTDDEGDAPAGWYEVCESNPDDCIYPTDEPPTHWMPLAAGPAAGTTPEPKP